MPTRLVALSALLVALLTVAACGPPPAARLEGRASTAAIWLQPPDWVHADADSATERVQRFVAAIPSGPQVLLVRVGRDARAAAPPGFDPLAAAVQAGHGRGLLVHAAMNLSLGAGQTATQARVRWKQIARHLATHYDIDGLFIGGGVDSSSIGVAAEAWLVKPDLVISGPRFHPDLQPVSDLLAAGEVSWKATPSQVVALDLSAWRPDVADQPVRVDSAVHQARTDADGHLGMVFDVCPDTLRLVAGSDTLLLETRFWQPPYRFVVLPDGSVSRAAPWVELRAAPRVSTTRQVFEFLGRTDPSAAATINGIDAKVYATGVFFDSVALAEGPNRVRLQAHWPDGRVALYEQIFERRMDPPRPALPLWIDEASVQPSDSLALLPTDFVRLSFRGSPGHKATARVEPGGLELPFVRTDSEHAATYQTDLHLSRLKPGRRYRVTIELREVGGKGRIKRRLQHPIHVRQPHDFPVVVTSAPESYVSYGLGSVRLGGPYVAEYPAGVVLQTTGRFGQMHRLRLGDGEAYVHDRYVDVAPAGTVTPGYFLTSISARATDSTDVVSIPRPEPVPWVVHSDPAGQRIVVTLHGVKTSSTWLSHRSGLKVVERVTWRQLDADTYEATLHLKTNRIWGYDVRPEGGALVVTLRHPPKLSDDPQKPLAGLKIAIEAGHGGSNTGAIGLSGLLERDVNLATSQALGELCRQAGAEVLQLRDGVDGVPYMARRDTVRASGADVFLSIHANAAGGGYLRASGTSMFYHDPFWAPLASHIYDRMLELGFSEFGTVGSFNYRPTRMSSVPAVLVEQAFMTHAEDEVFLASEAGRLAIAEKVLAGLLDWLSEEPSR